jgi:SagB-type dehydrogenase family enzyme
MGVKDKNEAGAVQGAGQRFQGETAYTPETIGGHVLDWSRRPATYKDYDECIERISLPEPETAADANLWQLLQQRRSRRDYRIDASLPLSMVSTMLWATQGITARHFDTFFRTAPSAGGLYPVETYLSVRDVEPIEAGIYHFRPHMFDLELLKRGNFSRPLAEAALGQNIVMSAQLTFAWSAMIARSTWKYRQRAYRYIYIDSGHIAQNLYLAAEALGLGVCAIGAFFDDMANGVIGLDGRQEMVIYMATVGRV